MAFIITNANEFATWDGTKFTCGGAISGAWTTVKSALGKAYNSATGLTTSISDAQVGWFRAQYVDQAESTNYAIFQGTYADSTNAVTPVSGQIVLSSSGTAMPNFSQDSNALRVFGVDPSEAHVLGHGRGAEIIKDASDQSITLNTLTKVTFDVETWDDDGRLASSTYTAHREGKFFINTALRVSGGSAGDVMRIDINIDGVGLYNKFIRRGGSGNETYQFPIVAELSNGSTVEVYFINSSSACTIKAATGLGQTFLQVAYLGR